MSNDIKPFHSNDNKGMDIGEQLEQFKQMRFKFGCLGINCLGWIIIITILIAIYFFKK